MLGGEQPLGAQALQGGSREQEPKALGSGGQTPWLRIPALSL